MTPAATRRFVTGAAVLAVALGFADLLATGSTTFHDDDLHTFGLVQTNPFGPDSLLAEPQWRQHINPLAAVLFEALDVLGPEWWMARVAMALMVAGVVLTFAFGVRSLTGSSGAALVTAAMVGSSTVLFSVTSWWTAATIALPLLIFGTGAAVLANRWVEERRTWLIAAAAASELLALGFSSRAQLVPLLALVVIAVASPPTRLISLRESFHRAVTSWPVTVPLFALALLQFLVTLSFGRKAAQPLPDTARLVVHELPHLAYVWLSTGINAVARNSFSGDYLLFTVSGGVAALIGVAILFHAAAGTIRNNRAAAIWVSLGALLLLSVLQIAFGRLADTSAFVIASVPRYHELTLMFLAVLIPMAWNCSGRPLPQSTGGRAFGLGLAAALGALWVAGAAGDVRSSQKWTSRAAEWADTYRSSLEAWRARDQSITLLNEDVPDFVVNRVPDTGPWATLEKATKTYAPGTDVGFDGLWGTLLRATPSGAVERVVTSQPVPLRLKGQRCGRPGLADGQGNRVDARIPPPISSSGRTLLLRVRLRDTSARGTIVVWADNSLFAVRDVALAVHREGFRVSLPPGTSRLGLQSWAGGSACFDSASASIIRRPGP